jgi:hypothetical protein
LLHGLLASAGKVVVPDRGNGHASPHWDRSGFIRFCRGCREALNRRVMKAYLLKESLDRLWSYRCEGAMMRYLKNGIGQLRWQRLKPMEKLAGRLLRHLEGILNLLQNKDSPGVVEAFTTLL